MASEPEAEFAADHEEAVSLRQLSDAFARVLGGRVAQESGITAPPSASQAAADDPAGAPLAAPAELSPQTLCSADTLPSPSGLASDNDPCEVNPSSILEALLFVGHPNNEPLTAQRAAELMRGVSPEEVSELVEGLNRRYRQRGCPYHVVNEGAGYRMTLRPEMEVIRNRFYGRVREARLSQAAIDVLAIVAYRQPITAEEVNQLRGRQCNHLLAQLVHRRLLCIERDTSSQRLARYRTTDRFLNVFGLESLNDLPRSDDVDIQ